MALAIVLLGLAMPDLIGQALDTVRQHGMPPRERVAGRWSLLWQVLRDGLAARWHRRHRTPTGAVKAD